MKVLDSANDWQLYILVQNVMIMGHMYCPPNSNQFTCFFFDFAEDTKQGRFHPMAV